MPKLKTILKDEDRERLYDFKHEMKRKEALKFKEVLRKTLDKCRERVLWLK